MLTKSKIVGGSGADVGIGVATKVATILSVYGGQFTCSEQNVCHAAELPSALAVIKYWTIHSAMLLSSGRGLFPHSAVRGKSGNRCASGHAARVFNHFAEQRLTLFLSHVSSLPALAGRILHKLTEPVSAR